MRFILSEFQGVYYGNWFLEEDGTVNASMAFARRVGNIRSHGRLLDDPMSCGGTSFLIKSIPTKLVVPDSIENNPDYNQKLEIVRLALRVGAVALHCTGLPLDELRKSPVKHFSSDKVDKFVSRFHGNVDFGSEWRKYKEIVKDLMAI